MLVRDNDRELIVEHGCGIREINAVFVEIDGRFALISLEIRHLNGSICTSVHTSDGA
jgi:hypothetical protein